MLDYQARALPDFDIAAVALPHCSAILYSLLVVLEIVLFRISSVVGFVEKVKAIGNHWAPLLARHHPDMPGNTDGLGIALTRGARFLAESRND